MKGIIMVIKSCWMIQLTGGYDLAQFRVAAETERHDVIIVLQIEGLCLCEGVVDHTCSRCMVQDTPIGSQVDILTSVKSSIAKYVVQREILSERERERESNLYY